MDGTIEVRVPATTSNLGAGFDALGLALAIHNTVRVETTGASGLEVLIDGEGSTELPRDDTNLVVRAIARGCREAGAAMPGALRVLCRNAIPASRGLGSSAAAIVAGLLVADVLSGGALGRERVFALATAMEGHPDNAAPAIFGGLQCAVYEDPAVYHTAVPGPPLPALALYVPDLAMPTKEARAVLPATISRTDAVYNVSRTALLVAAAASGRHELFTVATGDALHQRARTALLPAMPALLAAAREAGALGAWLSGAGSTLAAFARDGEHATTVAGAMASAARGAGMTGRAMVTRVDTDGARVETARPSRT